jgi:antitoxin PrlF
MKNVATVTSKGQITVPLDVRTHMGLREGDRVEFLTENGVTVMRPSRGDDNPFAAFTGVLGTFPDGIDEINAWVRDLRDDDERTE